MAKSNQAIRTCSASVKNDDGTLGICGYVFTNDQYLCPRRLDTHLSKFKTGLCDAGFCEGSRKINSRTEKPVKTCDKWKTCPCECHKMYDTMFREAGMPRQVVDNSGYSPDHARYWMPTPEERALLNASSISAPTGTPVRVESPAPGRVPPSIARPYSPTATGRAARGELEAWVRRVCDTWLLDEEQIICTPNYVSIEIQKLEGLGKPPSVGAISAVWERWVSLGFAKIEKKPTRFIGYTDAGIQYGLEALKEQAKQQHRSKQAATKRGQRV